jgi:ABC-type Co2+ transport system permease subunit
MIKKYSVQTLAITQNKKLELAIFYSFLIFSIPAFVHQQFLTGPIVNALLILSFLHLGKNKAFFLALIPSTVALSRGLLPVALAPMVPFIMISNCVYIEIFAKLQTKSQNKNFLVICFAALVKATFLFIVCKFVMGGLLAAALAAKVAAMMSWPQLWTAVLGGVLALLINNFLKKQSYESR